MTDPIFKMPPQKRLPPIWWFKVLAFLGLAKYYVGIDPGGAGEYTAIVTGYWVAGTFYVTRSDTFPSKTERIKSSVTISGEEWRKTKSEGSAEFAKFCVDNYMEGMRHMHDDFVDASNYALKAISAKVPWYLRLYNTVRGWFR